MTILHLLQRIIEQLDELNEQQATVSDLTQALIDMQVYAHSQDDSALCNTHMHWRHWHTRTCPFSRITRTDASAHSRVTCARAFGVTMRGFEEGGGILNLKRCFLAGRA